jgi:hypothetical protein
MTKRKTKSRHSDLELNQYRLRWIANELENGRALPDSQAKFLIDALWRIGEGQNANVVLGVKAKQGQRKTLQSANRADRIRYTLPWISSVTRPLDEGGQGMGFAEALDAAADEFGFSSETLKKYWDEYPELRGPSFTPPISSLPFRDKRVKTRQEPKS